MKYVIDACVAVKWVLGEQNSDKAIRIVEDARKGAIELLAPDFFLAECGSAVFGAERGRKIARGDARKLFIALTADCPSLREYRPFNSPRDGAEFSCPSGILR